MDDVLAHYYGDEGRPTTQVSMDAAQAAFDQRVTRQRKRSPRRRRINATVTKANP